MPVQDDPFWEFERSGWKRAAAYYDDAWSGATRAFCEPLLDAAEVGAGTRLLDIACGPGYVAGAALDRGAEVVGLDVADEMVALAQASYPDADFVTGDAHALPFDDGSFDAVTMNFGIHHVTDPELVFTEAARVLRPKTAYAFTSWARAPDHAPIAIAETVVEPLAEPAGLPPGPDFLRFSNASECEAVLPRTGFASGSVHFDTVRASWRIPHVAHLFEAQLNGGVRVTALLQAQSPERLAQIRMAMIEETRRYETTDGSCVLPIAAHIISARAA
jgi:ubiquinone/menaquinone biosynthesis C-methylase UbiE